MGTQMLVYTDGRPRPRRTALARRLADELIALREQLERAASPASTRRSTRRWPRPAARWCSPTAPTTPAAAPPGDSTFILRRLIERGIGDAALGPLWDPMAVRIAFDAGVGARLPLRIGGKIGPLSGDPLDAARAPCRRCSADMVDDRAGRHADARWATARWSRPMACEIVLISARNQAMGTDLFTQLGCDLAARRRSSSSSRRSTSTRRSRTLAVQVSTPARRAR